MTATERVDGLSDHWESRANFDSKGHAKAGNKTRAPDNRSSMSGPETCMRWWAARKGASG
jgi:hypothetical protein